MNQANSASHPFIIQPPVGTSPAILRRAFRQVHGALPEAVFRTVIEDTMREYLLYLRTSKRKS